MQAQIFREVDAVATVVAVDGISLEVTLREADGSREIVVCGPGVRNFDRIEVGNEVRARCTISLAARAPRVRTRSATIS